MNDLKAEIADLEDHLKFTKERLRESQIEVTELKRQNHQQNMIIKRYKKMVAEMNTNTSSNAFLLKGEGNNASQSDMLSSNRKQAKGSHQMIQKMSSVRQSLNRSKSNSERHEFEYDRK